VDQSRADPWYGSGTRGRARDFDLDTAVQIGLMVELVRLGFGAPAAAKHAAHYRQRPWKRLLLTRDLPSDHFDPAEVFQFDDNLQPQPADPAVVAQLEAMRRIPAVSGFEDETQLPDIFKRLGGAPTSYSVINIERIVATMRAAENECQARNKTGNRAAGC
jgi:hypothetical protein